MVLKIAFRTFVDSQQRGEKRKEIIYQDLLMSYYLLPEAALSVTEKLELFAARTEMNENPYNYGDKILCEMGCKEAETNKHIFLC